MSVTLPRLISTPRLELRALAVDQAAAQVEAANASLPELAEWMPWAQEPQDVEVVTELLAKDSADFDAGNSFEYSMWLGDSFIGRIGVHAVDQRIPKGEIGYWTATSYTHHGYAREACQGLIDTMMAAGFRRIEIRCDARNERSAAIPQALGLTQDAHLINDDISACDPTQLRDTLIFSITQ